MQQEDDDDDDLGFPGTSPDFQIFDRPIYAHNSIFHSSYKPVLTAKQEHYLKYGTEGEGFQSGSYRTNYISQNPKFYQMDKYYGKTIYTPFWNHMLQKYQQHDCGVDCEYLGPRNLLMSLLVYIVLAVIFGLVAIVAVCSKDKHDY